MYLFRGLIVGTAAGLVLAQVVVSAVEYKRVTVSESEKSYSGVMGYPLVRQFFRQVPEKDPYRNYKKYLEDKDLLAGNRKIYERDHWAEVPATHGIADDPSTHVKGTTRVPDYTGALERFHRSALRGNPIAAFEGLSLLKSFFNTNGKKMMRMRKDFAKVLYASGTCEGYLEEGDIRLKGLLRRVDTEGALKVYQEGYNRCRERSWYGMVLGSRIEKVKMRLRKSQPKREKR